jgi:two-component system phosphate regulon response regulator PhoB
MVTNGRPGAPALTPTERRVLDALRGQPGRAFTRPELMALAMPGTVVLERTIDVHVKALRKKLGVATGRIETVRRVGYRFVAPG